MALQTKTITVVDPEKNENVATITALGMTFEKQDNPYDEEFDRIAVKDAIRTFRGKDNQKQMIGVCAARR